MDVLFCKYINARIPSNGMKAWEYRCNVTFHNRLNKRVVSVELQGETESSFLYFGGYPQFGFIMQQNSRSYNSSRATGLILLLLLVVVVYLVYPLNLFSDTKVCWRCEIDVREDVTWCLTVVRMIGWT
jgi:hypothetical protein